MQYPRRRMNRHGLGLSVFLLLLSLLAWGENAMEQEMPRLQNGYFDVMYTSPNITSLRIDATGQGAYGSNLVADGKSITGVSNPRIEDDRLLFDTAAGGVSWPFPFDRAGYYDADAHMLYPEPQVAGGASHVMPIRKFLTSNSQTLFIEYFKRLPIGAHGLWLNLLNGNTFWVVGEPEIGGVLSVNCPGQTAAFPEVGENFLSLKWGVTPNPVEVRALPSESDIPCVPQRPQMAFSPSFNVTFDQTGKAADASPLATDLLQMAIGWHPETMFNGEWVFDAVRTFRFVDTRSNYDEVLRRGFLSNLPLIGYDRFEHFGMIFNWGTYPDYGAGALLNIPANNGAYDMRFLHVNAMFIIALSEYVMSTGDASILDVRPERWVKTDGEEAQPLCGENASMQHHVLAAGDKRLDGKTPSKVFSLGQSFTTRKPFSKVTLRLGTGTAPAGAPTSVTARITVTRLSDNKVFADIQRPLSQGMNSQYVSADLTEQAEPGQYEVRVYDMRSGKDYFGPGIFWWTEAEGNYVGGEASFGPFSGSIYDEMQVIFNYLYEYTGAKTTDVSYYQNDPEYNIANQKSGRSLVTMQNSFHECLGGGYDALMGLWYPPACKAMAYMASMRGDANATEHFLELERRAKEAYNRTFWYGVQENGKTFNRYFGCRDWDGVIHDFGFTYYNLEAADFGITSRAQARDIIWWLDTGYWKSDPAGPWQEDIYSIWQISPPYNTNEIDGWVGITGKLPYMEVLSNGGTRLMYEARDLTVRAKYLSMDNMHERNEQVLARFASPDRLTGGRTYDDPGGRGRWHFGEPNVNRADIEGYREIFPSNGSLGEAQVAAYLGAELRPGGLSLNPRVPSALDSIAIDNVGSQGGVYNFNIEAVRESVEAAPGASSANMWEFTPAAPFSKAGVQAHYAATDIPFNGGARVCLTLERKEGDLWVEVAKNWMRHVRDGQWVWVNAEASLESGRLYRLRAHDLAEPKSGVAVTVDCGGETLPKVVRESRKVRVHTVYAPEGLHTAFHMRNGDLLDVGTEREVTLRPGEDLALSVSGEQGQTAFPLGPLAHAGAVAGIGLLAKKNLLNR